MPEESPGERLTFTDRMTRAGERMRANAAARVKANHERIEMANDTRRSGMRITAFTVGLVAVNGVVGSVLMRAWLPLLASALLLVAAARIIRLSRWMPPLVPDPGTVELRRKARRTMLGIIATVFAAMLGYALFVWLEGHGA